MAISHDNIIYISNISKLGGVESFAYYMAKKYKDLDIAVVTKACDFNQMQRIKQFCPAYIYRGEQFECKTLIINWDVSALDFIKCEKCYMVIHADYSQSCYTQYPKWHDPRITKVLGITQYICDMMKKTFNIDCELCYNPIAPEDKHKRLVLVSATRLSKIKGGARMKALAQALDCAKVNYIWYVFTNERDIINSPNVVFIPERLDVYKWIQEADYLVQLSDTEACSYSISEAIMYGKRIIVTPLPYLKELGVTNENTLILDFDLKNIQDIVARIKEPKKESLFVPEDNYKKYLVKGKSKYKKELTSGMLKVKVKQKFRDMKYNGLLRTIGEEFVEDEARAKDLIERGFVYLVEEIKEKKQEVEKAVKEVKKEKAVKEKAVKVVKAPAKKNAKK